MRKLTMRCLVRDLRAGLVSVVATLFLGFPLLAEPPAKEKRHNPFAGDADAIAVGKSLFRTYCSLCHGGEGRGGFRGPDLIATRLTRAATDEEMFQVVKQGIQGTQMPSHALPDANLWRIIAFITHARSNAKARELTGNRDSGRSFFFGKGFCSNCHMVYGKGGRLGPDLSRIGAIRSLDALVESIREPNARFRNLPQIDGSMLGGYEPVRLITKEGETITGVIKNEDTFTIQVLDQRENFHSHVKNELEEIIRLGASLMPAYPKRVLSDHELEDLLTFLTAGAEERERTGPR